MIIWTDPDESLIIQSTPCAGLEALPGDAALDVPAPMSPFADLYKPF